jgi:hypothetical protein
MSQRASGYERKANDRYETPEWVTLALLPHIRVKPPALVLEPAAGTRKMVKVLRHAGFKVDATDLTDGNDFMAAEYLPGTFDAIITNPPYGMAAEFISRALDLTEPRGLVAMLLRTDYDHAVTRRHLFMSPFAKKVVLTKRIRWFENSTGSPSFNHAWFVWDWRHKGKPELAYDSQLVAVTQP